MGNKEKEERERERERERRGCRKRNKGRSRWTGKETVGREIAREGWAGVNREKMQEKV